MHVIVGGGLAGASAAAGLREAGYTGPVTVVCGEPEAPYERPPLTKEYLRGEAGRDKALVGHDWAALDVELLVGTAAAGFDPDARTVTLADGRRLEYDRLLLATGALPRRPPIPGTEQAHVIRTLADADRLRDALQDGRPLVVVGAGWIGCEVAASARQMGVDVTLIDVASNPLEKVLGPTVGDWFARLHQAHGVRLKLGRGVEPADLDGAHVVLGVGAVPDTRLAEAAGLDVGDGVLVDERLRTSAPAVFAAGDVAAVRSARYGGHVRVEHWDAAKEQGAFAARAMLGAEDRYDRLPYFFSDQYDAGMEYVGRHAPGDRIVVEGDLRGDAFRVVWLDAEDRVTAGMHVNDWDATPELRDRVAAGAAPARS